MAKRAARTPAKDTSRGFDTAEGDGHQNTRTRILNVAGELMSHHGYHATTLNDVGKQLGISGPAVYWHFESKEALLYAFMESTLIGFREETAKALETGDVGERLARYVRYHLRRQLTEADPARAFTRLFGFGQLVESLTPEHRESMARLQRSIVQLVRDLLVEGKVKGDFEFDDASVTVSAIIELCEYVFTWADPDGRYDIDVLSEHYVNLVLSMVRYKGDYKGDSPWSSPNGVHSRS